MRVALPTRESYQNIKCIPAEAGSAILFSHRIIHWGSKGRKGYHTPRIAFSFATSSDDFESSYFSAEHLPFPNLKLRLALNAGQMLAYWDRFQLTNKELMRYNELFQEQNKEFHKTYREKIAREMLNAVKDESQDTTPKNKPCDHPQNENTEGDVIDKALDALLDAKLEGGIDDFGDNFEDDFDDFEECVGNKPEGLENDESSEEQPPPKKARKT